MSSFLTRARRMSNFASEKARKIVHIMDVNVAGRRMKSFSRMSRREATLALLASALPLGGAQGNDYPSHPIKLIVPVPPGSGVDAVSRSLGAQMSEAMGVPIVTDYRPGASAV